MKFKVNKIAVWVITTLLLASTLSTSITYLSFNLNRSYIASELCVMRKVDNNNCQGSCYLKKQLKQQQERKQEMPALEKREQLIWTINEPAVEAINTKQEEITFPEYSSPTSKGYPRLTYHPPTVG